MKRLGKIGIWFSITIIALGIAVYFALTNGALQKSFLERRLPEGATLAQVKIRFNTFELHGFDYLNPKGDRTSFASMTASFDLFAAIFKKELRLKDVDVRDAYLKPQGADMRNATEMCGTLLETWELLAALDQPIHSSSIRVQGHYQQPSGSIPFQLEIGPTAPGASSSAHLSLPALPFAYRPKPIAKASAALSFEFQQAPLGGITINRLDAEIQALSDKDAPLLEIQLSSSLNAPSPNRLSFQTKIDLTCSKPEALLHSTPVLTPISATTSFTLDATVDAATISGIEAQLFSQEGTNVGVEWIQDIDLTHPRPAAGDLADIKVSGLSADQINQWIGHSFSIDTPAIETQARLALNESEQYTLSLIKPLSLQAFHLHYQGHPKLLNTTLTFDGRLNYHANHPLSFAVETLTLEDADSAAILEAHASGIIAPRIDPRSQSQVTGNAEYTLQLATLAKQPIFSIAQKLLDGKMEGTARIDPELDFPYYAEGRIDQLKTPDQYRNPIYSWQAQFKHRQDFFGDYVVKVQAGSKRTPTTSLEIKGSIQTEAQPTYFMPSIQGERFTLADFTRLSSIFDQNSKTPAKASRPKPTLPGMPPSPTAAPKQAAELTEIKPPLWQNIEGASTVKIDTLVLTPEIELKQLQTSVRSNNEQLTASLFSARTAGGLVSGDGSIQYTQAAEKPYGLELTGTFKNVNPAYFASARKHMPIEGRFSGAIQLSGAGRSTQDAFNAGAGQLEVRSTQGLITAFDLNTRRQLGLAGAELAGLGISSATGNDSINQSTRAFIKALPYFREIPYDSCELRLSKQAGAPMLIETLTVYSSYLRIDGTGRIDTGSLEAMAEAPLYLVLDLKARGPFAENLDTLNLLKTEADETGFIPWKQSVPIFGSLKSPDTGELKKLFYQSAKDSVLPEPSNTADSLHNELQNRR